MRASVKRLRRLEGAVAPYQRERAAVEAIIEARRRRLGTDYEPIAIPSEVLAGCRDSADRIIRGRKFYLDPRPARRQLRK